MTVTEVLQFADRLVFSQTGKHLDDLQEAVVKGVWQGQTYSKIADECNRSESRVRDIGYKLWEILSEQLGEDINKSNFCSTFERLEVRASPIIIQNNNHNFNFCSSSYQPLTNGQKDEINNHSSLSYYNLKQSPKITHFYDRTTELSTLSQWLENPNTRLISILGVAGVGKSTLVRHLIDTHTPPFDAIIWKNIKLSHSLDSILTEILTNLNESNKNTSNLLNQCLELFNKKRCLIILDNLQDIFGDKQFSGQYKPEHQGYKTLLQMITEVEHQSCFILISQEKCQEMISLDSELYPCHCLELSGLDESAKQILQNQGLKDEETWLQLIHLYEGNPRYLQYISSLIKDVFQSEVSEFITENRLILTEDFKSLFDSIWIGLSDVEKDILLEVSQRDCPISRDEIRQSLSLSSMDIINGLQSLNRRFLLTQLEGNRKLFNLSSVFREYLRVYQSI